MSQESAAHIHILLVEDNPGDVELVKLGLSKCKIANEVTVVDDGIEALAFLRQEGKYSNQKLPHLILLDINLPRKNGHEVLHDIRNDPRLKIIPIVMLTTSQHERDIRKSYELHANAYVSKPIEADEFLKAVISIDEFWLSIVSLPKVVGT